MLSIIKLNIRNLITRNIYYIILSLNIILCEELKFIDIKKLSLDNSYFVILNIGLYLYDNNFSKCALIHQFDNSEFMDNKDLIIVKELINDNKAYILCLVNQQLFIFDEYTYNIMNYSINEIIPFNDYYYDFLPYKIENNNISFIIVFNNDMNYLYFYLYNFSLNDDIRKQTEFDYRIFYIKKYN